MFPRAVLTLVFLMATVFADSAKDGNIGRNYLVIFEDKLELKFEEYANYVTKWLEEFNDKHLGSSDLGRMLHYADIKPKFETDGSVARSKL